MSFRLIFSLVVGASISIIGCSDSSLPSNLLLNDPASTSPAGSAVTEGNRYLWGIFDITLDPLANGAEVTPRRSMEGHLNAVKFLEKAPCSTCLSITKAQNVGPKQWIVDIQLSHPFVGLDEYTGFDVRGIAMFDSTYGFPGSGLSFPDPSISTGGALLNPDGYTRLFNPTEYPPGSQPWAAWEYQKGKFATEAFPTATLNPYKAFNPDSPRRYFGCAEADTQSYEIRFPSDGPLRFGYAVDANWAPPLAKPPEVPDDFPPEANMPEAYLVDFQIVADTLWYDSDGGSGGDVRFVLKVYDHQNPLPVSEGGDVTEFRWEVEGMTGWVKIAPASWEEGSDSFGPFAAYSFVEAPVPDFAGAHRTLIGVVDKTAGLMFPETAYIATQINVASGETCWSPGMLLMHPASENYWSHLIMDKACYIDDANVFHIWHVDFNHELHHITFDGSSIADESLLPGETVFEPNAVPDATGGVHLMYTDNPAISGGNVVYRYIDPAGIIGPPQVLSTSSKTQQFLTNLTQAPDGTLLALWMDSSIQPNRRLCGAYYTGGGWTPEMTLKTCYLPDGWLDPNAVADSSSVYHILYCSGGDIDLYYMSFDHGIAGAPELLVGGENHSAAADLTIDSQDRIYAVFEDNREGANQCYLKMRDPSTGIWTEEKNLIGHNYDCCRIQVGLLQDGRVACIWKDYRNASKGLYSKVFDPFLSEADIQALPDDELDYLSGADKNQTWMTVDPGGTLHAAWSDLRSGHWELYYSTCTP